MGNRVDEPKSSLGLEKIVRQKGRGREGGMEEKGGEVGEGVLSVCLPIAYRGICL